MIGAIMLIIGNLIADILLILTDPRIREGVWLKKFSPKSGKINSPK
jgi:hypothetical protein